MNQTENYQLSLWDPEDRIQRTDFNADNAKIEAALAELDAASEEHTSAIAKLGNCRLYTTSYEGTGTNGASGQSSLTFPSAPYLMIISHSGQMIFCLPRVGFGFTITGTSLSPLTVIYLGNTINWHSTAVGTQMNMRGTTYQVFALLDAAE